MAERAPADDPTRTDPLIAEFLGEDAGIGGPFALLGVPHEFGGQAQLALAVRRRLLQLGRHPLHLTPGADEVRLAIHTASAQLANPDLRAALAERWPPGQAVAMPAAWRRKMDAVSPEIARRAAMIVGASGGWNDRAKKRLAFMARAHRLSALELVRAVRPDAKPAGALSRRIRAVRTARTLPPEPTASGRMWLALHASLLLMLVLMIALSVSELLRPAPVASVSGPGVSSSEPLPEAVSRGGVPGPRERIAHHGAMEQELRNAGLIAAERPAMGLSRAGRVLDSLLAGWPDAPADARVRVVVGLTDIAAVATQSSVPLEPWSDRIERALEGGDPAASAGALAITASLAGDERVTVRARDALGAILSGFAPSPPEDFGGTLLRAIDHVGTLHGPESVEWWQRWAEAIDACADRPVRERESVVISALTRHTRTESDRAASWRGVATALAGSLNWRGGSAARRWLLDELAEPRASTQRLAVLTEVLATEISVPGVDVTMILDRDADMQGRAGLAQRYRSAWLAMRAEPSVMQARIAEAINGALRASDGVTVFREQFMAVESLARLNGAAALDFESDPAGAGELAEPPRPVPDRPASPNTGRVGDDWGRRLQNAGSEDGAMAVLMEARGAELSRSAASALVDAALRGSSRPIRERARLMIQARAASASVLLALEREVGDRPRRTLIALVDEMLGSSFGEAGTAPEQLASGVSAALLASAAERSGGVPREAEYAELGYRDALVRRAGLETGSPASVALAVLVERWRARGAETGEWKPGRVMPGLGAMVTVSATRGQLEASYHLALVQLMAGSLIERGGVPEREVRRVMIPLRIEWSNARSAIAQMLASQRAEARLWLLLLEGSP